MELASLVLPMGERKLTEHLFNNQKYLLLLFTYYSIIIFLAGDFVITLNNFVSNTL